MYTMEDVQLNNKKLLEIEKQNSLDLLKDTKYSFLYPSLDDTHFNLKIAERKEFHDTRYETPDNGGTIEEISDKLCNADIELAPHQMFVRNFLSFHTPYNGLLLYHGLGSGKTCSAISVAEEMRNYLKQMGTTQRILVIASPNVQDNFKLQLFDERKLQLVDGLWNINSCTGNKFLSEINPTNMKGIPRDKIVSQIKQIINRSYFFLGYIEFANYINKKSEVDSELSEEEKSILMKKKLTKVFKNRLIIIDEVHNIRMTDDESGKKVASELMKLVKNVKHMRLLFLSATPMYNSYKEIIWLLNILNSNDRRSEISSKDVFNSDGTFKTNSDGEEIGKELLMRKATGYVSFVRGENPYTYPFRIWPSEFEQKNAIEQYPTIQMNGTEIIGRIEHLSLYFCKIGPEQQKGYDYIISRIKKEEMKESVKNTMDDDMDDFGPTQGGKTSLGYAILQRPLEALNIVYPDERLDKGDIFDPKYLVGKEGLSRILKFSENKAPIFRGDFEYRTEAYGDIFSPDKIGNYSGKIENICKSVKNSDGVILVYSQYIDGGLVPIALALESMGLRRAGRNKSLFKHPQSEEIDSLTYKTKSEMNPGEIFSRASYVMITGDKAFSPDNVEDLRMSTNLDNRDGVKVKVILISQAGAEGLDFKFIRQVHVLEPWYNMNRIEQIIGRAIRTCSHKDLPFLLRNVQVFLYGSLMSRPNEEAADLYVYRLAELKSVQIGMVSRSLKEIAVDCNLNISQSKFTTDDMKSILTQKLSTGKTIEYAVGDRPYTATCDYMESCSYKCKPVSPDYGERVLLDTYNESFIMLNNDKIIQRIRDAFKERFFYNKERLIREINSVKSYPLIQIDAALNQLIEDKSEFIVDIYDRSGRLINIGELYLFQPLEINDSNITLYERSIPIEYKHGSIMFESRIEETKTRQPRALSASVKKQDTKGKQLLTDMIASYTIATTEQPDTKTDDWFIFCSQVISHLELNGWERSLLNKLLIHHIIETLYFDDMLILINHVEFIPYSDDEFISSIKQYLEKLEIKNKTNLRGIHLQKDGKGKLVVFDNDTNTWVIAQKEDSDDLVEKLRTSIHELMPMTDKLNTLIGYMSSFKKDYMIFKIRDISQKKHTGARCDQSRRTMSIKMLSNLGEIYEDDTTMSRSELCIIQEFIMRKFDIESKNGKRWFLNPTEATIVNSKVAF